MIEVDLLPEHLRSPGDAGVAPDEGGRSRARVNPWGVSFLAVALTIAPGTALLWWTQRAEAVALQARREQALADSTRLAGLRGASDSLTVRMRQIRERVALVEQLDRDRFAWPRILDEISWALPGLAWLISLRQLAPPPDAAVEVRGIAANPLAITRFVRNLGASELIADVRILGSQQNGSPAQGSARHTFTLVLRLAAAPGERGVALGAEAPGG